MIGQILRLSLLALLLLAAPAGPARGASLRGAGTFEFYFDLSTLPSRGGSALELFQIAIPTKEIRYLEKNGSFEAQVRIRVILSRQDGNPVYDKTIRMRDARREPPRATDLSGFVYAVDSCLVEPGRYVVWAKVEDLNRKKKTLLGWLRKHYESSKVDGAEIEVPGFAAEKLALGEPVLVWLVERGKRFVPNPMQLYGLKKDTLTTYVAARLPESSPADSIRFHVSLHNATGEVMSEETFSAPVSGGRSSFLRAYDLSRFSSGDYQLRVEAADRAGLYASASKPFAVAWELMSWQKPVRDVLVEARILLGDRQYSEFQRMTIGEQEALLARFWRSLDPTPHTAVNEAFEKFKERLRYADAHFGTFTRGALTDRGLMYVRFGRPDYIQQQVLPKTSEDLDTAVEQLASQYMVDRFTRERLVSSDRPRDYSSTLKYSKLYRGPGGDDLGSMEVWVYNIKGDPILEQDRFMTVNQGLRLLFIDVDGYGDYRLQATSEDLFGLGESQR